MLSTEQIRKTVPYFTEHQRTETASLQRETVFAGVRRNPKNLPKSGSGKVMWRLLQEAEEAQQKA